jgi:hypothetical protein
MAGEERPLSAVGKRLREDRPSPSFESWPFKPAEADRILPTLLCPRKERNRPALSEFEGIAPDERVCYETTGLFVRKGMAGHSGHRFFVFALQCCDSRLSGRSRPVEAGLRLKYSACV